MRTAGACGPGPWIHKGRLSADKLLGFIRVIPLYPEVGHIEQFLPEFPEIEALDQITICVAQIRFMDVLLCQRTGEHNHRNDTQLLRILHVPEYIQSIYPGQPQVQQHELREGRIGIWTTPEQIVQSLLPVGYMDNGELHRVFGEASLGEDGVAFVVFDQQDKRFGCHGRHVLPVSEGASISRVRSLTRCRAAARVAGQTSSGSEAISMPPDMFTEGRFGLIL